MKLLRILALLLMSSASLLSYGGYFSQAYFLGIFGPYDLKAVAIATDSHSNFIVLGSQVTSPTATVFFVEEFTPDSHFVWGHTIGDEGGGKDVPTALTVDNQNNVIVTGTGIGKPANGPECWTTKWDATGNQVFSVRYNGTGLQPDAGNCVKTDPSDNVYVGGYTVDGTSKNMLVVKYSPTGTQDWAFTYDGPQHGVDLVRGMCVDGSGVYVTGEVKTSGTLTQCTTFKLNPSNGQVVWKTQFAGPNNSSGYDIAFDKDHSGVIACGSAFNILSGGTNPMTMRMTSSNGAQTFIFAEVVGSGDDGVANHIKVDHNNTIWESGSDIVSGTTDYYGLFQVHLSGISSSDEQRGTAPPIARNKGVAVAIDNRNCGFYLNQSDSPITATDLNLCRRQTGGYAAQRIDFTSDVSGKNQDDLQADIAIDQKEDVYTAGSFKTSPTDSYHIYVEKWYQSPDCAPDHYDTPENTTLTVPVATGVTANDAGSVGGVLTMVSNPTHGTVTLNGDGSFTYIPDPGFVGDDQFEYKIHNHSQDSQPGEGLVSIAVDARMQSMTLASGSAIGGDYVNGTVNFDQFEPLDGNGNVFLSSNKPTVAEVPSVVSFVGANGGNFNVTTHPVTLSQNVTITATRFGDSASQILSVGPGGLQSLTIATDPLTGGTSGTAQVTLTGSSGASGVNVNISTDSVAISVPPIVSVPPFATQESFSFSTSQVGAVVTRTITAVLGSASKTASVTLQPPLQVKSLTVSPSTIYGGQSTTGTVKTNVQALDSGGDFISLSANSSVLSVPASTLVPQFHDTAVFTVNSLEVGSTVVRTISATYNAVTKTANITLLPSPKLTDLTIYPDTVEGGESTGGKVTLGSAANSGSIVLYLSSNSSVVKPPPIVTIPQGSDHVTFTINTLNVASTVVRTMTATLNSINITKPITIVPGPKLANLTVNPSTVKGGNPTTGTVTMTSAPVNSGIPIGLTSNSLVLHVPASVIVPKGSTFANFTVTTDAVATTVTRTISATYNGITKTASITLTP